MIKSGSHGRLIKARMFHYGWVKDPSIMKEKLRFQLSRFVDVESLPSQEVEFRTTLCAEYPTYDILKDYRGSHPSVMKTRIDSAVPFRWRRNRWLNPRFYKEVLSHGFKG